MALTIDEKALIVALELMRNALGQNTVALAANTQKTEGDFKQQLQGDTYSLAPEESSTYGLAEETPRAVPTKLKNIPTAQPYQPPTATPVSDFAATRQVMIAGPLPLPVTIVGGAAGHGPTPPTGGPGAGGRGSGGLGGLMRALGPIGSVLTMVAGKFAAVLGPLALVGQVLSSQISGFQLLTTSVKMFTNLFAPFLLPIMALFAAGLVAASEIIFTEMMPILQEWFDLILTQGIPAMERFLEVVKFITGVYKYEAEALKRFNTFLGQGNEMLGGRQNQASQKTRQQFGGALDKVLTSLERSVGAKGEITGLGSVGQAVQRAAMQGDPLELQMQKDLLAVVREIRTSVNRVQSKRDPAPRVYDPPIAQAARIVKQGGEQLGAMILGFLEG